MQRPTQTAAILAAEAAVRARIIRESDPTNKLGELSARLLLEASQLPIQYRSCAARGCWASTGCRTPLCTDHLERASLRVGPSRAVPGALGLFAVASPAARARAALLGPAYRALVFHPKLRKRICPYDGRKIVCPTHQWAQLQKTGRWTFVFQINSSCLIDASLPIFTGRWANNGYPFARNNATIAGDGNTQTAWLHATKCIYDDDEILVSYGDGFFDKLLGQLKAGVFAECDWPGQVRLSERDERMSKRPRGELDGLAVLGVRRGRLDPQDRWWERAEAAAAALKFVARVVGILEDEDDGCGGGSAEPAILWPRCPFAARFGSCGAPAAAPAPPRAPPSPAAGAARPRPGAVDDAGAGAARGGLLAALPLCSALRGGRRARGAGAPAPARPVGAGPEEASPAPAPAARSPAALWPSCPFAARLGAAAGGGVYACEDAALPGAKRARS
eukprot:tig00020538_g10390.t1